MTTPKLPQSDDSDDRQRALDDRRAAYPIGEDIFPPLAMSDGVPKPARPSLSWLRQVLTQGTKIKLNSASNRAALLLTHEGVGETAEQRELGADLARYQALPADPAEAPEGDVPEGAALESADATEAPSDEELDSLYHEAHRMVTGFFSSGDALEGVSTAIRGPSGRPKRLTDYEDLFRTLELPPIAADYATDEAFARLRVAGPNSGVIRGVQASELPDEFPIGDAQLRSVTGDSDSLARAGSEGRLFLCDYGILDKLLQPIDPGVRFVTAPYALFAIPEGGKSLQPIAIQCGRTPDVDRNPIFTPSDGIKWQLAKSSVQVADGYHHELISHLGRTHLLVQSFVMATHRHLAPTHPLNRLLLPHFEGTIFINHSAATSLIAPGGAIENIFAGTIESDQELAKWSLRNIPFDEAALPSMIAATKSEALIDYPWRDDATRIWGAVERWVDSYVDHYYHSDEDIAQDTELAAWSAFLGRPWPKDGSTDIAGVAGFRQPSSKSELVRILTTVIYTASAQHAAVNFPQWSEMSYAPAFSGAGWSPHPTTGSASNGRAVLDFLPPLDVANEQLETLALLGNIYHSRLGYYHQPRFGSPDWFDKTNEPTVAHSLLPRFQEDLASIETEIELDNRSLERRSTPYEKLTPSKIPMSINI